MKDNQLIAANQQVQNEIPADFTGSGILEISEFFCDTIQGENFVGFPATFLRLQHCSLDCIWCDTQEVWRYGSPYTFDQLFALIEKPEFDLIRKFKEGQHLVLTGGSPLKQQFQLSAFIQEFIVRYGFKPFIEVENECTMTPASSFAQYVDCWNNSPKLENSQNSLRARYKPDTIKHTAKLPNSWFKFVVSQESDWDEIVQYFLEPMLIDKSQIVLMPCGATRFELNETRELTIQLAVKYNVRYSTREHIVVWDKKTGV